MYLESQVESDTGFLLLRRPAYGGSERHMCQTLVTTLVTWVGEVSIRVRFDCNIVGAEFIVQSVCNEAFKAVKKVLEQEKLIIFQLGSKFCKFRNAKRYVQACSVRYVQQFHSRKSIIGVK